MFPCSKFAFRDATETFSNSLTGNAIWKCFWHRVYTNARDWRQALSKVIFSREIKCSRVWISLSKVTSTNDSYHSPIFHTTESSQSLSKWFKQRETTYLWIANLDELLALLQVNPASILRAMPEYTAMFRMNFHCDYSILGALNVNQKTPQLRYGQWMKRYPNQGGN